MDLAGKFNSIFDKPPIRKGVTFDKQGKPVFSPLAIKVKEAYNKMPNSQEKISILPIHKTFGGLAQSPTKIYLGTGKMGGDITTYAHELAHTLDPNIRFVPKLLSTLRGQPITAQPLIGLNEPGSRLVRALTRPTKSDLLSAYKHRVEKTFDAEVFAQAGMKNLMQAVDPTFDPEARPKDPDAVGRIRSFAADGHFYGGYPASFMEEAIFEAERLGRKDPNFKKNVADLRNQYNTKMMNIMGTTYSPNPYNFYDLTGKYMNK